MAVSCPSTLSAGNVCYRHTRTGCLYTYVFKECYTLPWDACGRVLKRYAFWSTIGSRIHLSVCTIVATLLQAVRLRTLHLSAVSTLALPTPHKTAHSSTCCLLPASLRLHSPVKITRPQYVSRRMASHAARSSLQAAPDKSLGAEALFLK